MSFYPGTLPNYILGKLWGGWAGNFPRGRKKGANAVNFVVTSKDSSGYALDEVNRSTL